MSRIHALASRLAALRADQMRRWFWSEVQMLIGDAVAAQAATLEEDVMRGAMLPYAAARELVEKHWK